MNDKAILLINMAVAIAITFVASRKSKVPGAVSLMVFSLFLVIWSLSDLLLEVFPGYSSDKLWAAIMIISMTCAASAQVIFSLSYTNHPEWINRFTLILLGVMPLTTQVVFWVKPWSTVFFQNLGALDFSNIFGNVGGRTITFYVYNLVVVSILLLLDVYIRKPRPLFFHAWIILAGLTPPLIYQIFLTNGLNLLPANIAPLLAFTLTGIGLSYGLFNQSLMEAISLTREAVVDGMEDGWMVLNAHNIVVDINPAAEKMIGLSHDAVYGQAITSIISDIPGLGQTFVGNQELEMKRSLKSEEGWRYMNIRISPLINHHDRDSGHLIVWQDVTKRRTAEDARQRARDEMFVLLNAISSAASNSIDLVDFLIESIYQIVLPFRSQIGCVFLMDERFKSDSEPRLFLASHFGLSTEASDEVVTVAMSNPLAQWVFENNQPLLIENAPNDLRLPPILQGIAHSCLLTLPLMTQAGSDSKFLGFLCIAKKEGPVFSQDEVVRLTMISDHIATLIDSDRRRKLAIALSERQRLLRDLHDSVSQKLYGLVTLTEAAQAALEAGSSINPPQVLAKIGESARQAVKEMRLFLYQMQPIEVEKEGLISVLHHRLAAVEGRADIKARLLADENIFLSQQKEVALYFIAQEALNNVLRHAHAKSITITLKQGTRNVILEIVDDGIGFDPKKVDPGGLGLRNMKERVLQADGKLKILSKHNEGTRIVVTVPRDQSAVPIKRRR